MLHRLHIVRSQSLFFSFPQNVSMQYCYLLHKACMAYLVMFLVGVHSFCACTVHVLAHCNNVHLVCS